MTIRPEQLSSPWRTVREVTTADTLFRPAIGSKCLALYHDGAHAAYWTSVTVRNETPWDDTYSAYRIIHDDGTTGPLVERTSIGTHEWVEPPPDDILPIAVLWSNSVVEQDKGSDTQVPWRNEGQPINAYEIAWMLWSEWEAFLRGPRVVHVPVTAEDREAYINDPRFTCTNESWAKCINSRLAARATAPVVTVPKDIDQWLASLAKAWPVLVDHANWIDGEFDNALTEVRRYIERVRAAALASEVAP